MSLEGRKIAVLAAGGYQELELWYPVLRAREDGASVYVLSSDPAGVTSNLGYPLIPDAAGADAADVDAVVLAGTVTGVPAYSDEQRAFVRAAHQGTARIYSVGTATTAVASILASIRGLAGWSFGV
ncbi:DJ-1/PfpI family protein, partial [Jiangella alkaliphila]